MHPAILAWTYVGFGDADQAMEIYQLWDDENWRRIGSIGQLRYGIGTDQELLRADPRYDEVLRKANRAWNLKPDGSIPEERETR